MISLNESGACPFQVRVVPMKPVIGIASKRRFRYFRKQPRGRAA
jgi:hypothetical protein